jgi:methylated-DNA-[protein]-cysteine S-methyltransferase
MHGHRSDGVYRLIVHPVSYRYTAEGWGIGELWTTGEYLVLHELARPWPVRPDPPASKGEQREQPVQPAGETHPRHGGARSPGVTVPGEVSPDCAAFVPDLCRRFVAQLGGDEVAYDDIPIDLDWCTPLQRDLALALRKVRWGEIVSYGELAERAGRPRAPRAAGSFCAENQLSLVLPCHRVVAADGIGGYGSSGVALKRRLLALEGVVL